MKKSSVLAAFSGLLTVVGIVSCSPRTEDFTSWVDPYIGTGGHGHVFMGAAVPFGMVQLGPTSIPQSWDWTSGYHISDTTVIGFAHTHLSGTGIGDLSDIVLMPTTGPVKHARGTEDDPASGMWSYFSRANEKTRPGYYATRLERYGVDVELTATARVGFHRYLFPADAQDARVVINLENGQAWDSPVESCLRVTGNNSVEGYRFSKGWARDQRVYFVAEFSRPFESFALYDADSLVVGTSYTARRVYGEALFGNTAGEPVCVKVALSPVSIEGARANMAAELPDWDFESTTSAANKTWNSELSKIRISTTDNAVKRTFYTALYHTMIAPSLFSDAAEPRNSYTTFSLWDTYRAAHPLMTIIHPERVPDMINSMLDIYKQQGKLPVWHLWGNETDCMVGNPAIPVVADAMMKGFAGFDRDLAYEAMKKSAMLDERGLNFYKQYGYIPYDKYNESVATTLEYALADWALAQVAQKEGHNDDYKYFNNRSKAYRHYFDPATGFLRGKSSTGEWRAPFDPISSSHRNDDYTEGNAWQYTWLVPHDVEGLAAMFGGLEPFHAKLDSLFVTEGDLGADASPDISGLIGQYAHGNEPGHHTTYIYAMTGKPWKTAELVRKVLGEMYHDRPDGLSGNEDVGQMSAWYVLSSMGFYQPEPAGGRYYFGSPIVDEAAISVGGGKTFTVKAMNNSAENRYIQSVTLNGEPYTKPWIDFADMVAGGELVMTMGPNRES
jgi:predicted alpha-1,2-mannosidase